MIFFKSTFRGSICLLWYSLKCWFLQMQISLSHSQPAWVQMENNPWCTLVCWIFLDLLFLFFFFFWCSLVKRGKKNILTATSFPPHLRQEWRVYLTGVSQAWLLRKQMPNMVRFFPPGHSNSVFCLWRTYWFVNNFFCCSRHWRLAVWWRPSASQ